MRLTPYTATDYAQAIKALLPPGAAWDWPQGGLGATLLHGTAEELARVDQALPDVLERAVETHRPKASSWHIREYQKIADAVVSGVAERLPRRRFRAGSHAGARLWSAIVDSPKSPFCAGSRAGAALWNPRWLGRRCAVNQVLVVWGGDFPVPLVRVDHLLGPFRVGSGAGCRLWGTRSRYVLRVRYYVSVVNPAPLYAALDDFKQSHVFLWLEDITGSGGFYA